MASEIFWVSITIPSAQCRRAGYLLAAKARKQAQGVKIARISSGVSINVTPGMDEHRACYALMGVSLVKHPHEVWVLSDAAKYKPCRGLVYISVHRTQALASAAAARRQAQQNPGEYCQVRPAS